MRGKRRAHGEGSIFKVLNKNGSLKRYAATLDLGSVNGKRQRSTVYGKTEREVLGKLRDLKRQQEQGVDLKSGRMTVDEFLAMWLQDIILPRARISTYTSYSDAVRLHILPHLGAHDLRKLTPLIVQRWLNELSEKGITRKVEYARAVFQRALNRAVKFGWIANNPVLATELGRVQKRVIEALTEQQARALLVAVAGHRLEALYRLALALGLRRGEALALLWCDVDFKERTIKISGSIQRLADHDDDAPTKTKLSRHPPKTKAGERTLPLPEPLLEALQRHQALLQQEREILGEEWKDHGLVFPSERGTPIEPSNLHRHFKAALAAAGLPSSTRFHDLRHSAATFMVAQGVHPRVVMEILGHTSIAITMELYAHVMSDTQREATDKVAKMFEMEATDDEEADEQ